MKGRGSEWRLAEKPTLKYLQTLGYDFIDPSQHASLRDGENQTIFRPHLVDALERLNGISRADAEAAALPRAHFGPASGRNCRAGCASV